MKWPSVVSALLLSLCLVSCKSKEKITETSVSISRNLRLDATYDDTLLLPWQLWSDVELPPVPVIRKRHAQVTATSKDTSLSVSKTATNYKPSSSHDRFWVIRLVSIVSVFFVIVVVIRRLFHG